MINTGNKVRSVDKDIAKKVDWFEAWSARSRSSIAVPERGSFQFSFPGEQVSKMSTILLQCVGHCFHRRRMRTGSCPRWFPTKKLVSRTWPFAFLSARGPRSGSRVPSVPLDIIVGTQEFDLSGLISVNVNIHSRLGSRCNSDVSLREIKLNVCVQSKVGCSFFI